jgi:hypothetical protein
LALDAIAAGCYTRISRNANITAPLTSILLDVTDKLASQGIGSIDVMPRWSKCARRAERQAQADFSRFST